MSKDSWQFYKDVARAMAADIRAADERYAITVKIPDHANVQEVEGGAFVEAVMWVPNAPETQSS